MNSSMVGEQEFFNFHEQLKSQGKYILKCVEISIPHKGRFYKLIWKD